MEDKSTYGHLLVVGPPAFRSLLVRGLSRTGQDVQWLDRPAPADDEDDPFGIREIAIQHPRVDAITLVVPTSVAAAGAIPGPVVEHRPVGLVPADEPAVLEPWLSTCGCGSSSSEHAASVWALLAMGKDRYLELGRDIDAQLHASIASNGHVIRHWPADRVTRNELCAHLATGPDLVLYLGHGRGRGWSGYQAVRWKHIAAPKSSNPTGAVVSLACSTLEPDPDRGYVPFGVEWIHSGRAGAYLGAVGSIDIDPAVAFARRLAGMLPVLEHPRMADLLESLDTELNNKQQADERAVFEQFRLLGNPLQRF